MTEPRILVVITARGGSKGLPGKNIREFAGKPTLAYTIEVAQKCKYNLHGIILSTEDEKIAECGRQYGVEVPFMRPKELALDATPSLPVLQHAAEFIEKRDSVELDWIITLQPTSPLRRPEDLDNLIVAVLNDPEATSAVNVIEVIDGHPLKLKKMDDAYLKPFVENAPTSIRRQDLMPQIFRTNGAGYITRRDVLFNENDLIGSHCLPVLMPMEYSIDIDTEFDFKIAEFIKNNNL